jgi:drug efflux transport system ATP-binding protein
MSAPPDTVVCRDLVRRFGFFTAVEGLSLTIAAGEVFGLLGANGSGKSTTIRMLTGLLAPTAGTITIDGVDVVRDPAAARARIGYVAQKVSLYPNLRVAENVEFYGGIYGVTPRALRDRVAECAPWLGLDTTDMRVLARELPAGARQRLAILLALLHRPRVVFLDEPTAGVDFGHRRALFDLLHRLADDGLTLIVTSHHLDEMERCSRLAFLDRGALVAIGTPNDLRTSLGAAVASRCAGTVAPPTLAAAFTEVIRNRRADSRPACSGGAGAGRDR